jgi:hypothetical protein
MKQGAQIVGEGRCPADADDDLEKRPRLPQGRATSRATSSGETRLSAGPAASPFVCLLNMSDRQVNLVLAPETHDGADKKPGMRAMTRTNGGTGPFALILRAIKSGLGRYWND